MVATCISQSLSPTVLLITTLTPPCYQSLWFPMKGSAEIVSTFYWACARFCHGHATILTPIFKAGFARAHHTPAEPFLDTSMKTVSCSKLQGIYVSQGYILANFFTASSFCSVRGRGFVKMQETLQIWRVQLKVTGVPQARALFDNSSVLTYGLPAQK